ncbi:MAG TPA: hypothetical protein PK767_00970, partial [Clostridiales bacterium]|nr:hypothetical protein [Clostridiales bacterium]
FESLLFYHVWAINFTTYLLFIHAYFSSNNTDLHIYLIRYYIFFGVKSNQNLLTIAQFLRNRACAARRTQHSARAGKRLIRCAGGLPA